MGRTSISRWAVVASVLVVLVSAQSAYAQYNGVFTSPWYNPAGSFTSAYHADHVPPGHSPSEHLGVSNIELWKKEVLDMQRAGLDFFAPYSFGPDGGFWADPAVFAPTMAQAIIQSGTSVRIAHFLDTNGLVISQYLADGGRIDPNTGLPLDPVQPFRLARGESHWKTFVYQNNIRRFFDQVPVQAQFRPVGRPVIFFYTVIGFGDLQYLGDMLEKIRQWFVQDYGVNPVIITNDDWGAAPEPARTKVVQQTDALYSWSLFLQAGERGALSPGGYPGGGTVRTHPLTGISVGHAGVGYKHDTRERDRRNGLTLTEDWNRIQGTHLRMVAAWYDYEEESGVSRTQQHGYQYVDLMNSLIYPAPILQQIVPGAVQTNVPALISFRGNGFRSGAMLLFSTDGVNAFEVPISFVSPQELQFSFNGGAPPGNYYVAIRNPDGSISNVSTFSVQP